MAAAIRSKKSSSVQMAEVAHSNNIFVCLKKNGHPFEKIVIRSKKNCSHLNG